ncbi:hypothetical protein GCM10010525_30590 [Glutamicibacter bergerei]
MLAGSGVCGATGLLDSVGDGLAVAELETLGAVGMAVDAIAGAVAASGMTRAAPSDNASRRLPAKRFSGIESPVKNYECDR